MYTYTIGLKNGKTFKIESELTANELICKIMPSKNEIKFNHFREKDYKNIIAFRGDEVAYITYDVTDKK